MRTDIFIVESVESTAALIEETPALVLALLMWLDMHGWASFSKATLAEKVKRQREAAELHANLDESEQRQNDAGAPQ